MKRVAVVGGGVVGISTGLVLQQKFTDLKIDIISESWSPNTTGDVSAGLIYPYLAGEDTPDWLLERLLRDGIKYFETVYHSTESGLVGVNLNTVYDLFETETPEEGNIFEKIGDCFPHHRQISQSELRLFPSKYRSGFVTTSFTAEVRLFLPYLMKQFESKGGKLITSKVESLTALLSDYDFVINCTGLGSRSLIDVQDHKMVPVRGQVIRVNAPWIRHSIMAGDSYILPNNSCVILGGTKQKSSFDLSPDQADTDRIMANCCRLQPSLAEASVIDVGVGLRPGRPSVRIELDPDQKRIIHNYGHGGSGVTLAWSSGLVVAELFNKQLVINDEGR